MIEVNTDETGDEFSEVDVGPGNIIILKSGPQNQVDSVTREFNQMFPRHTGNMSFLSIRSWRELLVKCRINKGRLLVVTPHLPNQRMSAPSIAEKVKRVDPGVIVIAWSLIPIKGQKNLLDATLSRRVDDRKKRYEPLFMLFNEFFSGVPREELISWLRVNGYTFP